MPCVLLTRLILGKGPATTAAQRRLTVISGSTKAAAPAPAVQPVRLSICRRLSVIALISWSGTISEREARHNV